MNLNESIHQLILNACNEKNDFGGNFSLQEKADLFDNIAKIIIKYPLNKNVNIYTPQEIEKFLLKFVKTKPMSIKYVAQETGLNPSGLYNWSSGASHLGPERMETILIWARTNYLQLLQAVIDENEK